MESLPGNSAFQQEHVSYRLIIWCVFTPGKHTHDQILF
jgi:hypothetical protein